MKENWYIIVRKGERLTHSDGTHYCTAKRDIWAGELLMRKDFCDWQDGEPAFGELVPEDVMKSDEKTGNVIAVCIEGKWRRAAPSAVTRLTTPTT